MLITLNFDNYEWDVLQVNNLLLLFFSSKCSKLMKQMKLAETPLIADDVDYCNYCLFLKPNNLTDVHCDNIQEIVPETQSTPSCYSEVSPGCCAVTYFTKEVNPSLAKLPLKFNGSLAKLGLTSFVK